MEKKYLMPRVALYKNLIDHDKILKIVKKTEQEDIDNKYYFSKWRSWLETGKSAHLRNFLGSFSSGLFIPAEDPINQQWPNNNDWLVRENISNLNLKQNYEGFPEQIPDHIFWYGEDKKTQYINLYDTLVNDQNAIEQREMLAEIYSAYKTIINDYIKDWDWSEKGCWNLVSNWDLTDTRWNHGQISLLKYGKSAEDWNSNMAMNYHTDSQQFNPDSRDGHFIFTITFYLSDPEDYDGGYLTFLNEENSDVIHIKPKAGDITIFPSGLPYWHAVEKINSGERYLIRTFLIWSYEGSEEWLANEKKYGEEVWKKMEEERIKRVWNNREYYREVVYSDDPKEGHTRGIDGTPFYVNKKRGYYLEDLQE